MPGFLTSIEQIRIINFGVSYLWNVRFLPAPPFPFEKWFPAIDIDEPQFIIRAFDIDGPLSSYSVPHRSEELVIKMTFLDNVDRVLVDWFTKWKNQIIKKFGGGWCVEYLNKVVRMMQVQKLDQKRNQISLKSYWVYPEGELDDRGDSESMVKRYDLNFRVCGIKQ